MKEIGFGFGQILSTPPKWLVLTVAIIYVVLFVAQQIISGDPLMVDVKKLQVINYLSNAQMGILAIAAMFGVKPKKEQE